MGTSAGSILGALLGAGVPAGSLRDHQLGLPIDGLEYDYESGSGGAMPGRPRLGIGSPALLWRTARHPLQVTPMAALASVIPQGAVAGVDRHDIDDVPGTDGWCSIHGWGFAGLRHRRSLCVRPRRRDERAAVGGVSALRD